MNKEQRETLLRELFNSENSVKIELSQEDLKYVINHCLDQRIETPTEIEKLYSREEVKQMLSVDLSTLHRWAKVGYLCPIKTGGKVRYKHSDVVALINGE